MATEKKLTQGQYALKNFMWIVAIAIFITLTIVTIQQSDKYGWDWISYALLILWPFLAIYMCLYKGIIKGYKEYKNGRTS